MTKHLTSISLTLILMASIALFILIKQGYYGYTPFTHNNKIVNAFMLDSHTLTYNPDGSLKNNLQSPLAEHIQSNDTTTFLQPRILLYTTNGTLWHIRAHNGNSLQGNRQINLNNHVILHQSATESSPDTMITTNQLSYYTNKNYAISHQATTITRPNATATGLGVIANFKTGVTTLLSHSHGLYNASG